MLHKLVRDPRPTGRAGVPSEDLLLDLTTDVYAGPALLAVAGAGELG